MAMREEWSQNKLILRVCPDCGKVFKCSGSCGEAVRIAFRQGCKCSKCVIEDVLDSRRRVLKNYKNLSIDEVFRKCYGHERGMEPEDS